MEPLPKINPAKKTKQYAHLIKIKDCEEPLHPNHITPGYSRVGEFEAPPKVGESFVVGTWSTSTVQAIIDEKTFRTLNSIYEWSLIEMTSQGEEAMRRRRLLDNAAELLGTASEREIKREQREMWIDAAFMIIKDQYNWSLDEVMEKFTITRKK